MNSSATIRISGDVAIIDVFGRISTRGGLGLTRNAIKDAVSEGHKNILLNLAGVDHIDSAGLGELAGAYVTINYLGGKMKLVHAQDRVNSMLHVTKMYTLLVTYTDEAEALASFAAN
jgi:anti-sigma B factor antagonist